MSRVSFLPDGYHLTKRVTVRQIQETVAAAFGIPAIEMISERRGRGVAHPRQVAMYLARELTPYSLPRIGQFFGGRDHTTVIHALRAVEQRIGESERLHSQVEGLRTMLGDNQAPASFCDEMEGA